MPEPIEHRLRAMIAASRATEVGLAACRVASGQQILIEADRPFHSASVFKLCVMVETYRQRRLGAMTLEDEVLVANEFRSIIDGSAYSLNPEDDSEKELYSHIGQSVQRSELIRRMIAASSNLATNVLMKDLQPARITQTMHELGADGLIVRRGVEDKLAYRRGLSNSVTARGLMQAFLALARGEPIPRSDADDMLSILLQQQFNEMIPAHLPPQARVAHKTGWVADYHHDAGIVYPPGGQPFVLSVLTRGYGENQDEAAHEFVAGLAKAVYGVWTGD